jgi:hypothetical protein
MWKKKCKINETKEDELLSFTAWDMRMKMKKLNAFFFSVLSWFSRRISEKIMNHNQRKRFNCHEEKYSLHFDTLISSFFSVITIFGVFFSHFLFLQNYLHIISVAQWMHSIIMICNLLHDEQRQCVKNIPCLHDFFYSLFQLNNIKNTQETKREILHYSCADQNW